jgi:serine/threonine protein kinase
MSLFLEALEKESEQERVAFLDGACGDNPALRSEVEALLREHHLAESPLDERLRGLDVVRSVLRSVEEASEDDWPRGASAEIVPGTVIGQYKIMEQIGEGGVGLVFVAAQLRPIQRLVALKVIKPGMDTREVIARFEAERQALALMDHPNIARVLDGGMTPSGRPFFVMELVRGVPITDFCDQNKLPTRERLNLFIDVCQAVQHAHQKGIIHRDLKPSNILVTLNDGIPHVKVIDFGVVKAIGHRLVEHTIYTRFTQMIGTPMYMSPEQAEMSALDVDTRSDIYALGVLLYELLTGATPFDRARMRSAGIDEVRRIVRNEDPPNPSTQLTTLGPRLSTVSAQRRTEPAKLLAQVRGDLDWIVMKAMEKQRSRRYETAAAMAEDIRRFLAQQPIEARPPSRWYRFGKFARRNKLALGTVALVAGALVLGTVVSAWQAVRASEARTVAEGLRQKAEDFAERLKEANVLIGAARDNADQARWPAAFAGYSKAAELQPDHFLVWSGRGSLYVRLGLWNLAAADYAKALKLGEAASGPGWRGIPQVFHYVNDQANYRKACAQLFWQVDPPTTNSDTYVASNAIRSCAIAPNSGISASDLRRGANRLLEMPSESPRSFRGSHAAFEYYAAGLASLRIGEYPMAISRFQRSLSQSGWGSSPVNYPPLAIAYAKLGRNDEAATALASADKVLDRWINDLLQSPPGTFPNIWFDWLEFLCLYREAHIVIRGTPPPEDPRNIQIESRALAALR